MMPSPVNILLMARTLGAGGTERQLTELARSLPPNRFCAHAACFYDDGFRAEELRRAGIPVLALPVRSLLSASAVQGVRLLRAYIRENGIRLVHTFDHPMNIYGVPAARLCGVPVVLSSQRSFRTLRTARDHWLLRLSDQLVQGIVVNAAAVRRHLIEDERIAAGRIHLCYNGIDTAHFQPQPRPGPFRHPGDFILIGAASVLRPEKGLDTLLEAFAGIRPLAPGLRLIIVGSGPEESRLHALARELALDTVCHFEPAVADVAPWLRSFDIFVLPSRSEALSNSLMEAMACGCAPVASRTGGNPELVEHSQNGLLFEPGDAGSLARQLAFLIQHPVERQRLAAGAAAFIHHNFSRESATARMMDIYNSVLAHITHKGVSTYLQTFL